MPASTVACEKNPMENLVNGFFTLRWLGEKGEIEFKHQFILLYPHVARNTILKKSQRTSEIFFYFQTNDQIGRKFCILLLLIWYFYKIKQKTMIKLNVIIKLKHFLQIKPKDCLIVLRMNLFLIRIQLKEFFTI